MADVRDGLRAAFRWRGDRNSAADFADLSGWWRDPAILEALGGNLARLIPDQPPTVVLAPQSRGFLVGSLVATHLGVGLVEMRKNPSRAADSDTWRIRTTPPDYRNRNLALGFRRDLIRAGDRVLFVDDWIATGGQALTAQALVLDAGASWIGAAVIVDGIETPQHRRELNLRALLHVREL